MNLGVKRSAGNFQKQITGNFCLIDLELLEEDKRLFFGELKTIYENSGMYTLSEVALSLAHELSDKEDISGGTISDDFVLSGRSAANHSSSRVLDLHLVQEDTSVLGQLDLACTTDQPIKNVKIAPK